MAQKGPILVLVPFFPTLICRNFFPFPSLLRPRRSNFWPGNSRVTSLPEGRKARAVPRFFFWFFASPTSFCNQTFTMSGSMRRRRKERKSRAIFLRSLGRVSDFFHLAIHCLSKSYTLLLALKGEKEAGSSFTRDVIPRSSSSSPFVIISNNFPSSLSPLPSSKSSLARAAS